ncbi:MAG: protein kinase [Phycisphaerales bacterium]|nr:protein kinase [Phycisphaerales bacterium]
MADEAQIRMLLEELMNSGGTPEEACADAPDLLPEVDERWRRARAVEAAVEELFPTPRLPVGRSRVRAARIPRAGTQLPEIGGYLVESILGTGGMGVVYKARQLKLNRPVAIKMLLLGPHATPDELACLLREAEAVASLRHAHIVQVYDVGDLDGLPFFTMEFLEGGTLAKKLGGVPTPARAAAEMIATLADAVQSAHDSGVVHRDLKPANILLTADGTPKIGDFSLARRFERDPSPTLSNAGVGTPSYMAPEQAAGRSEAFCPSVDVYALGAVLYEMLTGRPPFRADSPAETQRQVINEDPAPPSRLNTRVPRDLETICLKCLQKVPQRRYAAAGDLARDARRFLRGQPIAARPIGRAGRAARWARRNPTGAALIGAVFTLLVVAGAGVARESRFAAERRAEAARWSDRLDQVRGLEREGRFEEARAILGPGLEFGSDELLPRIRQARADLDLVERLDDIRMSRGKFVQGGGIDYDLSNRQYEAIFRERGLGEFHEDPTQVAARLAGSPVREALIAALDDWAACAPATPRDWILRVAKAMDPDPWRDRARDQAEWADVDGLKRLAATVHVDEQPVTLLVAMGTRWRRLGGDPTAFLTRVQQLRPDDFWVNFELGHLVGPEDPVAGLGFCRAALALRPNASWVHYNMGVCLEHIGQPDGAIFHYRRAIASEPAHTWAHLNLAGVLSAQGRLDEAAAEYRAALELTPADPEVHQALRTVLLRLGRFEDALADWQTRIAEAPSDHAEWDGYAELCLFLGHLDQYRDACRGLLEHFGASQAPFECERAGRACVLGPAPPEQVRRAMEMIDRAIRADPAESAPWTPPFFQFAKAVAEYRAGEFAAAVRILQGPASSVLVPAPQLVLAMALYREGRLEDARHTLALAICDFDWRLRHADLGEVRIDHILRREAEALMLPNLDAFRRGEYEPTDNDERLAMLGACVSENRHAGATRLSAAVFEADPWFGEEFRASRRYHAACQAALAGAGQGADAERSSPEERARWRALARDWLRADLTGWEGDLGSADQGAAAYARDVLGRWLSDADLAPLRDPDQVAQLPEPERRDCTELWQRVERSLAGTQGVGP